LFSDEPESQKVLPQLPPMPPLAFQALFKLFRGNEVTFDKPLSGQIIRSHVTHSLLVLIMLKIP
jgi:hypothetical protein